MSVACQDGWQWYYDSTSPKTGTTAPNLVPEGRDNGDVGDGMVPFSS